MGEQSEGKLIPRVFKEGLFLMVVTTWRREGALSHRCKEYEWQQFRHWIPFWKIPNAHCHVKGSRVE